MECPLWNDIFSNIFHLSQVHFAKLQSSHCHFSIWLFCQIFAFTNLPSPHCQILPSPHCPIVKSMLPRLHFEVVDSTQSLFYLCSCSELTIVAKIQQERTIAEFVQKNRVKTLLLLILVTDLLLPYRSSNKQKTVTHLLMLSDNHMKTSLPFTFCISLFIITRVTILYSAAK
jgi:hypothetical protein